MAEPSNGAMAIEDSHCGKANADRPRSTTSEEPKNLLLRIHQLNVGQMVSRLPRVAKIAINASACGIFRENLQDSDLPGVALCNFIFESPGLGLAAGSPTRGDGYERGSRTTVVRSTDLVVLSVACGEEIILRGLTNEISVRSAWVHTRKLSRVGVGTSIAIGGGGSAGK